MKVIKKLLPTSLKRTLKDGWQLLKQLTPGPLAGIPHLKLSPGQIYPVGVNFDDSLLLELKQKSDAFKFDRRMPLASIGSCFAEEFAYFVGKRGYHYLRALDDVFAASVNWGRVYTIPNFHQIVQYSINPEENIVIEKCEKGWFDPLREHVLPFYPDRDQALAEIRKHRFASRETFIKAERLILTLGQNEAWLDQKSGMVWARRPPQDMMNKEPDRFCPVEFSFEENKNRLSESLEFLFKLNPKMKIIATISPVAAYATFFPAGVVTQSFGGKCLLRSVLGEILKKHKDRIIYFPSFEMVLAYNPLHFNSDNRHVKNRTVNRIFDVFRKALVD